MSAELHAHLNCPCHWAPMFPQQSHLCLNFSPITSAAFMLHYKGAGWVPFCSAWHTQCTAPSTEQCSAGTGDWYPSRHHHSHRKQYSEDLFHLLPGLWDSVAPLLLMPEFINSDVYLHAAAYCKEHSQTPYFHSTNFLVIWYPANIHIFCISFRL